MEKKKPLVVVLTRSYSTGLSVIRSVGSAGYTVDLIASAYKKGKMGVAASSKYVRHFVEVISPKVKEGTDDALIKELLKYEGQNEQKPVLFPTDDYTTSIMDQNRSALENIFVMPTIVGGGDGCLTQRMDKTVQAEMAQQAGLLTPLEWIISLEDEIEIPEDMVYPCFCKPIESVTGYKKEMAKCRNRKQLKEHLKKLKKTFPHRSVLVQEFLDIENEIDLSGVCLDQEIIIPAIIKKWNVAQHERGVTLAGKVVPVEELGDLYEKIVAMLRRFHYVGMFDMELNVVGDKIYFNEVNLRSGGPNFSYFMSGVNLPALFVKEASGVRHTPEEEKIKTFGKSFVYEKVAWEDYMHGYMTKRALEDRLAAADITLLHYDEDPKPSKVFMRQMRLSIAYSKVKKVKKNLKNSVKHFKKKVKRTLRKIEKGIRKLLRPVKKLLRKAKYRILDYPQAYLKNRRNPFAEKPRVVVAGRNYCSNLCMARSLGQAGYEVEVVRIFQVRPKRTDLMKLLKPDAYSKYVKAFHICIANRKPKTIVKKLIRIADPYRKMLLIPSDDLVANIADEYMKKLSPYYVMPNVDHTPGEINRLMSKSIQKELAKEAGLPVINSCVIDAYHGLFTIPKTVTYPCFIKPNVSKNSSKSRIKRCEDEEELRGYLTEFSKNKRIQMLVEDYVEIGREYSILGVSAGANVAAPGYFGAVEGGHDGRRGVAMIGMIRPTAEQQKLIDDISEFISTLNFEGLYDVDLIETVDGKMYFVELNMRFGASGYAVTESGANLPGMFADYMLFKKPVDPNCRIDEAGKTFISEKVMIEEYISGYLTKEEMSKHMKAVDVHFVSNEKDPKPYRHFKKFYNVAKLHRAYTAAKNK